MVRRLTYPAIIDSNVFVRDNSKDADGNDRAWESKGVCASDPYPDAWVPTGKLTIHNELAKSKCFSCPVMQQCSDATRPEIHGGTIRAGRLVKSDFHERY